MIRLLQKCLLWSFLATLLPVLSLRWLPPPVTAFMVRAEIRAIMQGDQDFRLRQHWVAYEHIAPVTALAVVAAEDQLFNQHFGFDLDALEQAMRDNEAGKRLRGASTLTQQTAKNLFLYPEQSYVRKALEAYLTVLMELTLPKQRILEIYLNIAEFGEGIYGVGAASETFFSKQPDCLTAQESALLAAVLPNPQRLRVDQPTAYVLARKAWILKQMRQLGGAAYLGDLRVQGLRLPVLHLPQHFHRLA